MKIAIVAESFLPQTNGVVNSVLRILEHLQSRGHEALVIAPADPRGVPDRMGRSRIVTVPSWALPSYPQVRVASGRSARLVTILRDFGPDVVHLASPFELGVRGARAAGRLGIPIVAAYQTDVPAYAAQHGAAWAEPLLWRRVREIHERAAVTLVPSRATHEALTAHGVPRLVMWRRGVDADRFHPDRRSEVWRNRVSPQGRPIVGYVGRLAPEKQVHRLLALRAEAVDLVIVGDGPSRGSLERLLPDAHFTGMLHGENLATAMASLDVLVHTGDHETFCQVIQEAMASGVPVVAPAIGGPLDLVDPSRTGWLYEPGNATDLRSRTLDLVGDDYKRWVMGAAARRSVEGRTWSAIGDELLAQFASVAGLGVRSIQHLAQVD